MRAFRLPVCGAEGVGVGAAEAGLAAAADVVGSYDERLVARVAAAAAGAAAAAAVVEGAFGAAATGSAPRPRVQFSQGHPALAETGAR